MYRYGQGHLAIRVSSQVVPLLIQGTPQSPLVGNHVHTLWRADKPWPSPDLPILYHLPYLSLLMCMYSLFPNLCNLCDLPSCQPWATDPHTPHPGVFCSHHTIGLTDFNQQLRMFKEVVCCAVTIHVGAHVRLFMHHMSDCACLADPACQTTLPIDCKLPRGPPPSPHAHPPSSFPPPSPLPPVPFPLSPPYSSPPSAP